MYDDEFELTFDLCGRDEAPQCRACQSRQNRWRPEPPHAGNGTAGGSAGRNRLSRLRAAEPQSLPRVPNGRSVLISGGDRGIGAAAARAFYAAGYRVAVLYHTNADAAAALEQELPGVHRHPVRRGQPAPAVSWRSTAAEQALGRVDVLVSNAGIAQQKLFTDITPDEWQRMLDVNLSGAFHLCQLALPGMIRRKAGPHPDREQHVGPDRRQLRGTLFRCESAASSA